MSPKSQTLLDLFIEQGKYDLRLAGINREQALAYILCGDVCLNDERCRDPKRRVKAAWQTNYKPQRSIATRPGDNLAGNDDYHLPQRPFVSRAGDKLDSVLQAWGIDVSGKIFIDAGSSTGGFSHCLILRGVQLVHAVDVGYNLIDYRLRSCPQLRLHERCNIMTVKHLQPMPDAAVADLSFRSLEGVASHILSLCKDNDLYALIKPQFEKKHHDKALKKSNQSPDSSDAGEGQFFAGVVGDDLGLPIVKDLLSRMAAEQVGLVKIAGAGVRGRKGNQEYLAHLRLMDGSPSLIEQQSMTFLARDWQAHKLAGLI